MFIGCSRVNGDNYLKIKEGMQYDEVTLILGEPTERKDIGLHGAEHVYISGKSVIKVEYLYSPDRSAYVVIRKSSENL